jgi:uncharacterized protein (TIGR02996 family)
VDRGKLIFLEMTFDSFVQAIVENPDDVVLRLAFADWLEEHGEPERAEFIRVQCHSAQLPHDDDQRTDLEKRERKLLEQNCDRWFGRRLGSFLENAPRDHPSDAEVHQRASEYAALPLVLDGGGFDALRMDGSVVVFFWDQAGIQRVEANPRLRYGALLGGAKKYPELRLLIPPRPVSARSCPNCSGTGKLPDMPAGFICYCAGLGWLP